MRLVGRRLPDLLIGILIVVLALGLGSLLLTQRNRSASVPSELPASPPAASIPAAPGTQTALTPAAPPSTPAPTSTAPAQTDQSVTPSSTDQAPAASPTAAAPTTQTPATQPPAAQTPAAQTPATQAPVAQPESPAATPPQSAAPPATTGPVPTDTVQAPVTPQPDTTAPPVSTTPPATSPPASSQTSAAPPSADQIPAAAPRSGGPVATSENRTPLKRDYRISLGTFGSLAEANTTTAPVKALGYTVYPIDLGSQVVAQVGPFADAKSANAALSDIARVYGNGLVYAPRQSVTTSPPAPATSQSIPAKPASTPSSDTRAHQRRTGQTRRQRPRAVRSGLLAGGGL